MSLRDSLSSHLVNVKQQGKLKINFDFSFRQLISLFHSPNHKTEKSQLRCKRNETMKLERDQWHSQRKWNAFISFAGPMFFSYFHCRQSSTKMHCRLLCKWARRMRSERKITRRLVPLSNQNNSEALLCCSSTINYISCSQQQSVSCFDCNSSEFTDAFCYCCYRIKQLFAQHSRIVLEWIKFQKSA